MIEFKHLQGITPQSNPLHGSTGGEMLAPLVRQIPIERIARHGVLQPIIVRPAPTDDHRYVIVIAHQLRHDAIWARGSAC